MKTIYIIILAIVWGGCTSTVSEKSDVELEIKSTSIVELTKGQEDAIELELGDFIQINLADYVHSNGVFDVPPSNRASVNSPLAGFVKKADFHVGNKVAKGDILAIIEHPDFIQLQQNYLESLSLLNLHTLEIQRQQELATQNVNSKKQLQNAEADYAIAKAQVTANGERLKYLGISLQNLEMGNISSSISLRAPISGYITQADVYKGKFMTPEEPLYEIINNEHLHVELNVFEKDYQKIKLGQKITFTVPAFGDNISYEAEVHLINKTFDSVNKSVLIHGHLHDLNSDFIRGLYVEAKIWTKDQTSAALPNDAIISSGGIDYIFVKEGSEGGHNQYRMTAVKAGLTDGDFTQITPIDNLPNGAEIVTKGSYYLLAVLKKGDGDDDH